MRIFAQNEPLTDAEFDRLAEFLKGCAGGKAINVEELDGFFAALVSRQERVVGPPDLAGACSRGKFVVLRAGGA